MNDYLRSVINRIPLLSILILSLAVLFSPHCSQAQQYAFYTYDDVHFPDIGEVNGSMQDSRGFLWFAGSRGIVRYDGYEFQRFSVSDGLSNNHTYKIVEAPDGKLWICSWSGISVYDPETGKITVDPTLHNLVVKNVQFIKGMSFYATSAGLIMKRGEGFYAWIWRNFNTTYLQTNYLVDFTYDPTSETFWLASEMDGIYRVKLSTLLALWELKDKALLKDFEGLPEAEFQKKYPGIHLGFVYHSAQTIDSTCFTFNSNDRSKSFFLANSKFWIAPAYSKGWFINKILRDNQGNVWVHARDGVYQIIGDELHKCKPVDPFDKPTTFFQLFGTEQVVGNNDGLTILRTNDTLRFSAATGLVSDDVINCLRDDQGIYWITTKEGILQKLVTSSIRKYNRQTIPAIKETVEAVKHRNGDVYIACENKLVRYSRGKLTDLPIRLNSEEIIRGLALDKNQDIVLLSDSSLFLIHDNNVKILASHIYTGGEKAVFSLDRSGKLWINCGWFICQWTGDKLIYNKDWEKAMLYCNFAYTGPDNTTFFGNWNHSYRLVDHNLYRYGTADFVQWDMRDFDHTLLYLPIANRLRDNIAMCGGYAFDSRYYLGTFTGSLMRLEGDSLTDCDLKKVGNVGAISRCVADGSGNLYFLASEGVVKIDRSGISRPEELSDQKCSYQDLFFDRHGNRLYATSEGLLFANSTSNYMIDRQFGLDEDNVKRIIEIDPDRYLLLQSNNIVIIDLNTLWNSGTNTKPVAVTGIWSNNTSHPIHSSIDLPRGQRSLKIRYASLDFVSEHNNRYSWKLDGLSDSFSLLTKVNEVNIHQIPPGTYTFQLKATNIFGKKQDLKKTITINVPAYYHETMLFKLMVAVIVIGVIVLIYTVRLLAVKRANAKLEERVATRTKELSDALENVKVLSGLIPICANCKHVRDDKGYWLQVEHYITERSDAQFSHSICPECMKKLYPGYYKEDNKDYKYQQQNRSE